MTLGAQNALWLAAQVLLARRRARRRWRTPAIRACARSWPRPAARTVAVDVDADGLPPDAMPKGVDVVFTTASHHCPTNATMPVDRRARACWNGRPRTISLIVEDDYEFEMSFLKATSPVAEVARSGGAGDLCRARSRNRCFRGCGWAIWSASEPFIREARALRAIVLRHPPGHIQRTAAYFLSLGHYDAQINRMAQAYKRRRAVMEEAIRDHGLEHRRARRVRRVQLLDARARWRRYRGSGAGHARRGRADRAGAVFFDPATGAAQLLPACLFLDRRCDRSPKGLR